MRGKTDYAISLYNLFVENLKSIGDFTYSPAKTRVAFQRRMRFAAINRIGRDFVNGHLILKKQRKSTKFYHIEQGVIHHFKITRPEDIDDEFREFLREAHSVGMGGM
ncbi:MAG: hypothetical protein JSW58_02560 [Candidatus Latescibacterota bacterium]|nr:MAG: hypothetical protein JSW58_02560 [Candidatus Latescibacterota bacterium]